MPKRKQKHNKKSTLSGVAPPPPPPMAQTATATATAMPLNPRSHGQSHPHNSPSVHHSPPIDPSGNHMTFPPPPPPMAAATTASNQTTAATATLHIPTAHAEILKKYNISDKISKLKATLDSVLPRPVLNSLESLMIEQTLASAKSRSHHHHHIHSTMGSRGSVTGGEWTATHDFSMTSLGENSMGSSLGAKVGSTGVCTVSSVTSGSVRGGGGGGGNTTTSSTTAAGGGSTAGSNASTAAAAGPVNSAMVGGGKKRPRDFTSLQQGTMASSSSATAIACHAPPPCGSSTSSISVVQDARGASVQVRLEKGMNLRGSFLGSMQEEGLEECVMDSSNNRQPPKQQQQKQQQQQGQMDHHGNHEYMHQDNDGNDDEEGEEDVEDDDNEEDEDEDDDYDPDDHVVGVCLHCGRAPPSGLSSDREVEGTNAGAGGEESTAAVGIQVSCDECHSFICSACHWCHEYQANHEIRVCDRCDAFYCKNCDEMDQCEDCGEVVCAGCGALCSCKFCGCGLCEDCATACGRCGIVLCQRDSKFAVECDTCKMSYCLVCLASGTKDPCVRCGHRTSKRVEQLVHLRLKSIYKAFKQSGAALEHSSNKGTSGNGGGGNGSLKKGGNMNHMDRNAYNHHSDEFQSMDRGEKDNDWVGQISKEFCSVAGGGDCTNVKSVHSSVMNGDVETVFHVAAAAAGTGGGATGGGRNAFHCESVSNPFGSFPRGVHTKVMPHLNHDGSISFRPRKEPKKNDSDKFASRTEEEADAAAAALLAELDKEKEQEEASSKAKKSKKKKKKERQAAKEKEKETKSKEEIEEVVKREAEESQVHPENDIQSKLVDAKVSESSNKIKAENMEPDGTRKQTSPSASASNDDDNEMSLLADFIEPDMKINSSQNFPPEATVLNDDIEGRLADCITSFDVDGIEGILAELKGIPGRAALRKNAKKALKRIREERSNVQVVDHDQEDSKAEESLSNTPLETVDILAPEYKSSEPLLKLVSSNHRVQSNMGGMPRAECVMHMAPGVVGWVIGKGGQRIRDVMEESGAKVWIDQDSMGPQDMRIVYVSGSKKSVDSAVRSIKDLVAKAPVGGTTIAPGTVPTIVNDTGSVTSTRSSLTSTPVSFGQNIAQQGNLPSQKVHKSPLKKPAAKAPAPTAIATNSKQEKVVSMPPSPTRSSSMPPPGMENVRSNTPTLGSQAASTFRNRNSPKIVRELFCEPRFVPLLIGRRGWTVKNIQDTSGARVDIDQKVIPRKITISGGENQVNDAIRQVKEVLSYPHAQPNYNASGNHGNDRNERIEERIQRDMDNPIQVPMPPLGYGIHGNSTLLSEPLVAQPLEQMNQSPFAQKQYHANYPTSPNQMFMPNPSLSTIPSSAFLNGQSSSPLPLRNTEMQFNASPVLGRASSYIGAPEAFDSKFLRGSFSHEESKPDDARYNDGLPLNAKSDLPFLNGSQGSPSVTNTNFAGHDSLFSLRQQPNTNEHDILTNLFGRSMPSQSHEIGGTESLLHGFGNLSFGEPEGADLGLGGANWDWEGLVGDDKASGRSFGLGGVRLDTSSEAPDNDNTDRNDVSGWRM